MLPLNSIKFCRGSVIWAEHNQIWQRQHSYIFAKLVSKTYGICSSSHNLCCCIVSVATCRFPNILHDIRRVKYFFSTNFKNCFFCFSPFYESFWTINSRKVNEIAEADVDDDDDCCFQELHFLSMKWRKK